MCLTSLVFHKKQLFPGGNWTSVPIKVYKNLRIRNNQLTSSYIEDFVWHSGENCFLRDKMTKGQIMSLYNKLTDNIRARKLDVGFHVYLHKKTAIKNCLWNEYTVEFTAFAMNYVAHGKNNGRSAGAVFTKLHLDKDEYNRIMRPKPVHSNLPIGAKYNA